MIRLALLLLASCAAAQGTRPPATSVINDQHTTGGLGPVTSAQPYVAPPAPEAPPLHALDLPSTHRPPAAQLVKADLTTCTRARVATADVDAPRVAAATDPVCAATRPRPHPRAARRSHAR